jgi:glutamyl-tRNA synthetase
MGQGNKKLSKRDPEANALGYRDAGFLPEGLLNYMALLGWAIAEDRDVFTLDEMVQAFEIGRVNPNPARFDLKKCEAINASHMRLLSVDELTVRLLPYLHTAGLVADPPTADEEALLRAAVPLVHERIGKLTEAVDMLGFLLVDEAVFTRDPADVAKLLDDDGRGVVKAAHDALAALDTWTTEAIDEALRQALVEELGLKPRNAFGPVRVAVTGSRVSPPLFESLELLGRERSLARLSSAQAG